MGSISSLDALSGPSYASQVASSSPKQGAVRDDEDSTPRGKTEAMTFADESGMSSPTSRGSGMSASLEQPWDVEELDASGGARRKSKINSGEFKKEGGILGKLGFEREYGPVAAPLASTQGPQPPAAPTEMKDEGYRDLLLPADQEENDDSAVFETDVSIDHNEQEDWATPLDSSQAGMADAEEEEVEVLESAEKKNRFWKGKRRMRRSSRAASDAEDDVRVSPACFMNCQS